MPVDDEYLVSRDRLQRLLAESYFSVPTFQRPYVWGREEIRDLTGDFAAFLDSDQQNYFLGLISLEESEGQVQNIIDGQQRLISFTLLCAAIYRLIRKRQIHSVGRDQNRTLVELADACCDQDNRVRINFFEEDAQTVYEELMYLETDPDLVRLRGGTDEADLDSDDDEDDDLRTFSRTSTTLLDAYECFQDEVQELFPLSQTDNEIFWARLERMLRHVLVAFLRLPPNQEALTVFQRMNNRGRQLSEDEKVKTVFAIAANGDLDLIGEVSNRWVESTNTLNRPKTLKRLQSLSKVLDALATAELEIRHLNRVNCAEPINGSQIPREVPRGLVDKWNTVLFGNITEVSGRDRLLSHLRRIEKASNLTYNLSKGELNSVRPITQVSDRNELVLHAARRLRAVQQVPLAIITNVRLGWSLQGQKALMWALDRRVLLNLLARERSQSLEAELDRWTKELVKLEVVDRPNPAREVEILRDCVALTSSDTIRQAVENVKTWSWAVQRHRHRIRALFAYIYFESFSTLERRSSLFNFEDLMRSPNFELDHIYPKSQINESNKEWIHTVGNLTLIEKVLNNIMRDDLPNTPEKLNRLRNSQVGSENRVIADIIEQHGDWGRVQVDQRQKELEARLSEFFHRDLPTHLIINL